MIHVKHILCNLADNMTYSHALSRVGWILAEFLFWRFYGRRRSEEGLTLETLACKLFTGAKLIKLNDTIATVPNIPQVLQT